MRDSVRTLLRAGLSRIEEGWCQGRMSVLLGYSRVAVCSLGALEPGQPDAYAFMCDFKRDYEDAIQALADAITPEQKRMVCGDFYYAIPPIAPGALVIGFNDNCLTKKEDVIELFKRAIGDKPLPAPVILRELVDA